MTKSEDVDKALDKFWNSLAYAAPEVWDDHFDRLRETLHGIINGQEELDDDWLNPEIENVVKHEEIEVLDADEQHRQF